MDIKETLSNRLHNLLEEYNMSQAELSKRSAVTEATISNFLNCKQLPKLEVVSKIADVLNVSVDYLLGKTNIRKTINEPIEIAANMGDKADLSEMSEKDKQFILDMIERLKGKKD